jgi:hypothetical protein
MGLHMDVQQIGTSFYVRALRSFQCGPESGCLRNRLAFYTDGRGHLGIIDIRVP